MSQILELFRMLSPDNYLSSLVFSRLGLLKTIKINNDSYAIKISAFKRTTSKTPTLKHQSFLRAAGLDLTSLYRLSLRAQYQKRLSEILRKTD